MREILQEISQTSIAKITVNISHLNLHLNLSVANERNWIFHSMALRWRHTGHDGVAINQPYDCLYNRLFRRRSKKTSKLRVTGLYAGNSRGPVNSPYKWPVTRKMFPFHDVIMYLSVPCHVFIIHIPITISAYLLKVSSVTLVKFGYRRWTTYTIYSHYFYHICNVYKVGVSW